MRGNLSLRSQRSMRARRLIVRIGAAVRRANARAATAAARVGIAAPAPNVDARADAAAPHAASAATPTPTCDAVCTAAGAAAAPASNDAAIAATAAAVAAAVAAAEQAKEDKLAPRGTITASTTEAMRVEWNYGGVECYHTHQLHGATEFSTDSTEAWSPPEPVPDKPGTERLSTGGCVGRPITHPHQLPRLSKLRSELLVVVGNSIRDNPQGSTVKIAGPGEFAMWTNQDACSENRPTASMYPQGDCNYARAARDGSRKIYRSLTVGCAPKRVVRQYEDVLRLLPATVVKEGLVGKGLFVREGVRKYALICEYTCNRISGRNLERLHWALDYHGKEPNLLVDIPSLNAVVDPRVCGNEGQFANHCCTPNARLVEVDVCGRTLIFLAALRPIQADEEIYLDYEWFTGRLGSPKVVTCLCHSEKCRLAI